MTESTKTRVPVAQVFFSITLSCVFGWGCTFLAVNVFKDYAAGLFIWLPVVMGAISTLLYAYDNPTNKRQLRNISLVTLVIFCLGLLTFAWEGVVCLIMAAPLGLFFAYLGHLLAYLLIKDKIDRHSIPVMILLLSSVPLLMAFENAAGPDRTIRSITTSAEIDADPLTVWKNVIRFPPLGKPTELIFKYGISYPIDAQISGQGVGAIRHCNFSTGSFVEPISVWEEGKLLKFDVDSQPEPLKELSLYGNIHPNHLHDYWVSRGGQFKLTALPNGHTLLEGTTWYVNRIEPGFYWTIWSDYIVHTIHQRVLEQIRIHSEANNPDAVRRTGS